MNSVTSFCRNACWYSLSVVLVAACGEKKDYRPGRDTLDSFGNGRIERIKVDNMKALYDHATRDTLVWKVMDWREVGDFVYVLGEDGKYTVLNYRTGVGETFGILSDVPPAYKAMASKLKRG
jgi:hypothetical protein